MADNQEIVLDIQNLTVQYVLEDETVEAVNEISLQVGKGKTLGLVGETGAGKTTTALAILRLVPDPPGVIKSGSIRVGDIDILSLTKHQMEKIRGKDVSMIFQDPMTSLNPVFTVGEQIAESILLHERFRGRKPTKRRRNCSKWWAFPSSARRNTPTSSQAA